MSYNILHDFVINAEVQQVFEAVSNPSHLNNWWTKECRGEAKLGHEYTLYFAPEYDWRAEVTVSEKNHFELSMTKSNVDWPGTKFGFYLNEKNGNTEVSFYHKGWKEENSHFRISSFCWALLLNGLKQYVEKGVIIPFEERS